MDRKRTRKPHSARDQVFDLSELFPDLDPRPRGESERLRSRKPSPKEIGVFRTSRLAGRLRWLLRRRASAEGLVPLYGLRKALREKFERFRDVALMGTAPAASGCNWVSVGPRNINGRVKCLAIDPTNRHTLYAGTANGGVWKTADGGQSWVAKMHDEDALAIGAIAIDPGNSATVYAGTGEAVYLLSGSTPMPPGSSNHAWFYEGVGVYKSIDNGDTWTLTGAIANDFIYRIAVDPMNSSNLLCVGYSAIAGRGGLCRSIDGGQTWATVATGVFTDVLFDPNNAGRAYSGQYNGGVLKSTDSGQTWTTCNTGLPTASSIGRVSLTLAQANSNVLYAKIENDATGGLLGVYRTASAAEPPGGWAGVADPRVDRVVNAGVEEPSNFLWWCSYIVADPTDATGNTVYAAGVDLARSGDGGATWTLLTKAYPGSASAPPPTHSDQHDLVFDPTNRSNLYIANDGGVFAGTYTGGAPPVSWAKVSTGLVSTQFYDVSVSSASRSMFGGGAQDNGSMVSTGGQSWRHALGGDGGYVAFHPTDPYTFYVQYQKANVYRTTDGGMTLTPAKDGITGGDNGIFPATVLAIDPNSPNILFNGTDKVFRTTTGGVGVGAWSAASTAIGSVTEITIAPSSSAVVYAGTITGGLYRATDGGATSTSFTSVFTSTNPVPAGWPNRWLSGIAVHPTDANRIYVTFLGFGNGAAASSDHVWKGLLDSTTSTWSLTLISTGLLNVPVGGIVFDPVTSYLYLATDVGVFRSTNDGASWQPFEAGLPNTSVVDLALNPVRRLLKAATHGRGMYQISLTGSCPEVDIYLRDNIIDTGDVPSPSGEPNPIQPGAVVRHWQSADIKVDAPQGQPPEYAPVDALTDGVEFDDPAHRVMGIPLGYPIEDYLGIPHENPVRGQPNRVYVQVHNRGSRKADSVTVKLLYADAGAGLPALPGDFWAAFPGDGFDQTHWKPIGTTTLTDLVTETPRVLHWDWVPPSTTSDHVCLLAMIDSPQDPLLPQTELNVDVLTPGNKRVTHKNVHPVDPPLPGSAPGATSWVSLDFNNASREHKFFTLRIENISDRRGGLRMILPRVALQRALNESLSGFRPIKMRADGLRRLVEAAERTGGISRFVAKLAKGFRNPQVFEVQPGRSSGELRGVLVPPGGKVQAVFSIVRWPTRVRRRPLVFEATQYEEKHLVGGSEFILAGDRSGARSSGRPQPHSASKRFSR